MQFLGGLSRNSWQWQMSLLDQAKDFFRSALSACLSQVLTLKTDNVP